MRCSSNQTSDALQNPCRHDLNLRQVHRRFLLWVHPHRGHRIPRPEQGHIRLFSLWWGDAVVDHGHQRLDRQLQRLDVRRRRGQGIRNRYPRALDLLSISTGTGHRSMLYLCPLSPNARRHLDGSRPRPLRPVHRAVLHLGQSTVAPSAQRRIPQRHRRLYDGRVRRADVPRPDYSRLNYHDRRPRRRSMGRCWPATLCKCFWS